jgi:hypothetical protein
MTNKEAGRILTILAISLLVLGIAFCYSTKAGTLEFTCAYEPGINSPATHMRVYDSDGVAISDYIPIQVRQALDDNGNMVDQRYAVYLTNALPNCVLKSYYCTAKTNNSGDSNPSPTTDSTVPRPEVDSVVLGNAGLVQVTGQNFVDGSTIRDQDGVFLPTEYRSCQLLETQQEEPFWEITVLVPNGLTPAVYTLPIPAPGILTYN